MKLKLIINTLIFSTLSLLASNCGKTEQVPARVEDIPLRVMSFNIRYSTSAGDTGDLAWSARKEPCIKMIKDEKPDIIGVQELRPDQRTDVANGLDSDYLLVGPWDMTDNTNCGGVGIVFLKSRFEIADKGFFWLSETPEQPSRPTWGATDTQYRTTVWTRLCDRRTGRDIYFINTHLPFQAVDNEARAACVKLILERMKSIIPDDAIVFVTGDMNASLYLHDKRRDSISEYLSWLKSGKYTARDLTPDVRTFNSFGSAAPRETWDIDHILYRNVNPIDYKVVNSPDYGVEYISDHYPIVLNCKYQLNSKD